MKKMIFISSSNYMSDLIKYKDESAMVIALSSEVSSRLNEIKEKHIFEFSINEDKAIEWIKKWPKTRIDGTSFISSMTYDDFSVWWLMESWLYYSSVYYDSVRDVLLGVQTIKGIIEKYKPDNIIFVDDGTLYSEIIKTVSENKKINTMTIKSGKKGYSTNRDFRSFLIRSYIDIGSTSRKICWRYKRAFFDKFRENKGKKIIFVNTYAWERVRNDNGKIAMRDPFNTPIIEQLKKENKNTILSVHIPIGNFLGIREIFKKSRRSDFTVIEEYDSEEVRKNTTRAVQEFRKKWNELVKNDKFRNSFVYDNINIFNLLEKQFSCYFSTRFKGHIRDYFLIKKMIEQEKPDIMIYPGETSEFSKTMFHLCRERKIPTIGMQHGMLYKYLGWIHEKNEVGLIRAEPEICPIPDITTVYGQYYKKMMLNEGKYPEKSIAVTGNQRFDRIISEKEKFIREVFLEKHRIDRKNRIITYITSPLDETHAKTMTECVMDSVKGIENAHLYVKLHPSETKGFYKKIARKVGIETTIEREVDLYDVLNASDIVITHLSTAAIEAMIFDKPVIIINLTGKPDRVPYVKKGAAFGVYRSEDLVSTIDKILSQKNIYNTKRKHVKKFLYNVAYKLDGRASMRIAQEIEELMKRKV